MFKTITIKKKVYDLIKNAKQSEESFSDLFERTYSKDTFDLARYRGILKTSKNKADEIKDVIKKMKKDADKNFYERLKNASA